VNNAKKQGDKMTPEVVHDQREGIYERHALLTGSWGLHDNVKPIVGRLHWPIMQDGLPWGQLLNAFLSFFDLEAAESIFISSVEVYVDLPKHKKVSR
jgi:hypothetical protein